MSQVFISHVEEDRYIVEEMARGLEAAGYTTWYYERDSVPGLSYLIQTGQALERSQIVLLLISRDSLSSLQVTSEVIQAYESGKSFIPVLRDITHTEFQIRQPEWRRAVGAATSIPLPADGAAAILPRIIAGLHTLGVEPAGEPGPISPPVPAPPAPSRPSRWPLAPSKTAVLGLVLILAVGVALYALWSAIASPPVGEIRRFVGPLGVVGSVAFASDGRRLLSAGWDSNTSNMLLWDVETGVAVRQFGGRTPGINSAAFASDGRYIVSGGEDHTLRLWDVQSGQELRRFEGQMKEVYSVAFAPDGGHILSGDGEYGRFDPQSVRLWDVETGRESRQFKGHEGLITSVAFSPDGRRALSAGMDTTVRLWDVESGQELRRFQGHTGGVWSVVFAPDGRRALSGGGDAAVLLWNLETGEILHRFEGHTKEVYSVAFAPNGRQAASGGYDYTLRLWRLPR